MSASATPSWKVHFALLDEPRQEWEGEANKRLQEDNLARRGSPGFSIASSPESADAIVFLESNGHKDWRFIERLTNDRNIRQFPQRCCTLNYEDTPVTFLPGVYVNLPKARHDKAWTRAGGYYLGSPNPFIKEFELGVEAPRFLLSFRGAISHPLRQQLCSKAETWREYGPITRMDRWFNHSAQEQRTYLAEITQSQFVLCPRGIGGASHRLFEVMQLGRVPVILADDWMPPPGPDWPNIAVFVRERDIDTVPKRLEALSSRSSEMGARARSEWERWLAPEVALIRQLQSLRAILDGPLRASPVDIVARWRSRSFRREHGWTLAQRGMRRIRRWSSRSIALTS